MFVYITSSGKFGQSHKFLIGLHSPRDDHGDFSTIFDLPKLHNCLKISAQRRKGYGLTTRGYAFKVKVLMEEVFSPSPVPVNYNSKLTTGMVGLENLGATCYLNALLQVIYCSCHVYCTCFVYGVDDLMVHVHINYLPCLFMSMHVVQTNRCYTTSTASDVQCTVYRTATSL